MRATLHEGLAPLLRGGGGGRWNGQFDGWVATSHRTLNGRDFELHQQREQERTKGVADKVLRRRLCGVHSRGHEINALAPTFELPESQECFTL